VWPEVVAPIASNTIQSSLDIRVHNDNTAALKTYTDSYYTVLEQDQNSRFTRAADLFSVVLTERISPNSTSALENVLVQAFNQSFTGRLQLLCTCYLFVYFVLLFFIYSLNTRPYFSASFYQNGKIFWAH